MQKPHVVNLEHLIEGTAEQLEFFERAVVLLAQASDAELIEHAKGYLAGRTDSVGAQLMQHTHRLHPIRYLEYLESNTAEDLEEFVVAVRRQARFMRNMLHEKAAGLCTEASIKSAVDEYHRFLASLRGCDDGVEPPSALVDLVWHTHMQDAERYRSDCLAIVGRLVDHDDEIGDA